jgi:arabinofuranosyltransferase
MIRSDAATRAGAAPASGPWHWGTLLVGLLLFSYLFVTTAWVVDDAYITFRTVDNFIAGHGLTWNTGERVQAYTHPLWMFVMVAVVAVTGEYFYSVLALSWVLASSAVLIGAWSLACDGTRKMLAFVLLVVTSKSIIDYASSGLENPLAYLLVLLFYTRYLGVRADLDEARTTDGWLWFIAILSYLTRQDTLLLYAPALAHLCWTAWGVRRFRALGPMLLAASPAVAWLLFSTFYYGFPYPNTAAAKMFVEDLSLYEKLGRGSLYFLMTARWDALGFLALGWASWTAWRGGHTRPLLGLLGIALYLAYVLSAGAAATHMAGRFFAVPFLLGFYIAVRLIPVQALNGPLAGAVLAYALVAPVSPWKFNTSLYQTLPRSFSGYIDTVWFAHREGTGLRKPEGGPTENVCFEDGRRFGASADPLRVGGCGGGDPIGFFAFAAGPDKWIVDPLGLSDPLLARLQPCVDFSDEQWRPGHFKRELPDGYVASILAGRNEIQDPDVRRYYEVLREIVSGQLWSVERMWHIVRMNAGRYDGLVEKYNAAAATRARLGQCRP